jgi:hypothetical protein
VTVRRWTLLSRPDCSLCETLHWELAQLLGSGADIRLVDISGDAELESRYGTRIPVLLADEEFVCAYRLDPERVASHLRQK